jgi:ribonuclease HI
MRVHGHFALNCTFLLTKLLYDSVHTFPEATARRTLFLLDEWKKVKSITPNHPKQRAEHWLPPDVGWHKANADGAFMSGTGIGGGGAVIRDHHGRFLAAACHFFRSVSEPERSELLACRRAVLLAREAGVSKLALETDCLEAVSKLQKKELGRSVHGPLVEEIKTLLLEFSDFTVSFVRRSCNEVAHSLAQVGCGNNLCNTWLEFPPGCIVNLLASDCAGA